MLYPVLRSVLFALPPENVHHLSMNCLKLACSIQPSKRLIQKNFQYSADALTKEVFGLKFKNPVGLGAGFDKNAIYLKELEALGFGFVEIGTVTPIPQKGNEKPRLFRLPKDEALINRMGFNNDGVYEVRKRVEEWRTSNVKRQTDFIIGGNIGKNKITANEDAWKDYETCFRELFDSVDYFVVNVSSPNTPGLRELQEKKSLKKILSHLQTINHSNVNPKPLLLKIAPDLNVAQLDDIIQLASEVQLDGIVATNTTVEREHLLTPKEMLDEIGAGGLSGKPLRKKSTEIVQYLSKSLDSKISIVASGGVFSGSDAKEKLDAGAALVQVWTGFIYEGPAIVKRINRFLVTR
ncbi:MAG TPA: quinone-dependent dihydroorotate dehydrogenase [Parafilimonas sp.]|nr:quinone-dependent dihydroorotate dehydrogenase [Parafilimonas sp.]